MFEQDVKLARMLVEKIRDIRGQEEEVRLNLQGAQQQLDEVQKIREEREAYLSILSEAADLLDSKELVVENPDTTEQQERVDELEFKLEELAEESQKYNKLIEALREKAPQLFAEVDDADPGAAPELSNQAQAVAEQSGSPERDEDETAQEDKAESMTAGLEEVTASEATEEEEVTQDEEHDQEGAAELAAEDGSVEPGETAPAEDDQDDTDDESRQESASEEEEPIELHVGSNGHAESATQSNGNGSGNAGSMQGEPGRESTADDRVAPDSAHQGATSVVKVAVESPERTLSRFNLDHLKKKEAFTFGRGAAYVVDGDSVMDRLPYYDFNLRGVLENQTRDELARDIDVLSTELHGRFHIVYNSGYTPSIQLGESVDLDCADGDGGKEASDEHIRNLVGELIARHTCVCVITGDVALADSVRGQNIHILQLHDFFRA